MSRSVSLVFFALLLSGAALGQHTYTITPGPNPDGSYTDPWADPIVQGSFGLDGVGNAITGSALGGDWGCANGNPGPSVYAYQLNNVAFPCEHADYTPSGTMTITLPPNINHPKPLVCKGYAQAEADGADGTILTLYFSFRRGGRWGTTCQTLITGGTFYTPF
jgi:hypothetical protein